MSNSISRVRCFLAVTAATLVVATCEPQTVMTLTCFGPGVPTKVVAGPGEGQWNATQVGFGSVVVFDQAVTETPDPTSKYLGQIRGILVIDALAGISQMDVFTLDFKNDQFNGSVSIFGTENLLIETRQVPIAGGSGDFLFIKGYVLVTPFDMEFSKQTISSFNITMVYKKAASLEDF